MRFTHGIRSFAGRVPELKARERFWIVTPLTAEQLPKLRMIGFSSPPVEGERLLAPGSYGTASRRNAEGDVIVHRDQPMEKAYRQIEWHWREFRGRYDWEDKSKIVDVSYKRYPRTEVPPIGVEISIIAAPDAARYAAAGPFTAEDDRVVTNTVNMFIELFQECEIRREDFSKFLKVPYRRLNWVLLPPGKNPWDAARPALDRIVDGAKEGNRPVIRARLNEVGKYKPDFIAEGRGGFDGYIAFGFPKTGLCVLESRHVDNATYVLKMDSWEQVSALSKAEILGANLHQARLVHRRNWFDELGRVLHRRKAA